MRREGESNETIRLAPPAQSSVCWFGPLYVHLNPLARQVDQRFVLIAGARGADAHTTTHSHKEFARTDAATGLRVHSNTAESSFALSAPLRRAFRLAVEHSQVVRRRQGSRPSAGVRGEAAYGPPIIVG